MRESRTYGSVRGACDETHVPTATAARVHHAARRRGGAWPLAARAQQPSGCGAIGVLMAAPNDPEGRRHAHGVSCTDFEIWAGPTAAMCAIDYRWADGDVDRHRNMATEIGRARSPT